MFFKMLINYVIIKIKSFLFCLNWIKGKVDIILRCFYIYFWVREVREVWVRFWMKIFWFCIGVGFLVVFVYFVVWV